MDRELTLDGNAAGGLLRDIFAREMTAAGVSCAGCDRVEPVGALIVHANAPGTVVRCPHCDQVLMRIVRSEQRWWLDLRGLRWLELRP